MKIIIGNRALQLLERTSDGSLMLVAGYKLEKDKEPKGYGVWI